MLRHLVISVVAAYVLTPVADAQQLTEVVHLKNGDVVSGIVIEQIPNETIKIQLRDGRMRVIEMSEIDRIVKEPVNAIVQWLAGQRVRVTLNDNRTIGRISGTYSDGFDLVTSGNMPGRYYAKDIFASSAAWAWNATWARGCSSAAAWERHWSS